MGWTEVLATIASILGAVMAFLKWIKKKPIEDVQKKKTEVRDEIDHFKKTGRPKW